jgi:hypothetical protein
LPDFQRSYYKLILQCRVDPTRLQVFEFDEKGIEQYWLVPDGTAIRPCKHFLNPKKGVWILF